MEEKITNTESDLLKIFMYYQACFSVAEMPQYLLYNNYDFFN